MAASTLTSRILLDRIPFTATIPSNAEKVASVLLAAHCCPRCVLRFLGVRDRTIHNSFVDLTNDWAAPHRVDDKAAIKSETSVEDTKAIGEQAVKKLKVEKEDVPLSKGRTCAACLGLLHCDHKAIGRGALDIFHQQKYKLAVQNQTFVISTRLPSQLAIRQRSYQLLLAHELGESLPVVNDQTAAEAKPLIEVKEILKYLLADAYAEVSGLAFDANSPFSVSVHFEHKETEEEYKFLTEIPDAEFKVKKTRQKGIIVVNGISYEKITRAAEKLSYEHFRGASMCPPPPVANPVVLVKTELLHIPIYVAGRYLKLERHISNSPWVIGGNRMTEHSVEEFVAGRVDEFFRVDAHKFYSSGREDADVLMLGRGRPYYLELINPRRVEATPAEMAALQAQINEEADKKVGARNMQIISKEETKVLKDAADTKSKSYTTLVKLASPVPLEALTKLSQITNLEVKQQNPTRVPRRADLMRDKLIETLHVYPSVPLSNPSDLTDEVRVDLRTSAGTYVKEFMHGDNGRTKPCLKDLLEVEWAKVLELDVVEVHLDWPKEIQEDGAGGAASTDA
ncbi:hypothetical protein PhCBS80983_g00465 [Powellomyces hirtus]|uniref:tRNA pseudouridine(55) synthase n=1 Tax=Powellomyces hirtus TaxID=109895 RepID=A0A507EG29_9FUNG|nr:hypothetical protein PhCBS80983_g00465 [Powellomyces hirtus]